MSGIWRLLTRIGQAERAESPAIYRDHPKKNGIPCGDQELHQAQFARNFPSSPTPVWQFGYCYPGAQDFYREGIPSDRGRVLAFNGWRARQVATQIMTRLFIGLIRVYQYLISPLLGPRCRFTPTCSEYSCQALVKFGAFRGSWLGIKRLCRCHPRHPGGYDPIP